MDKQTQYIHVDIVNVVRLTNIDPGLLNIILTGKKKLRGKSQSKFDSRVKKQKMIGMKIFLLMVNKYVLYAFHKKFTSFF